MNRVKVGAREVELRFTLLTLKRVKQATGQSMGEVLADLRSGKVSDELLVPTLLWAMVGHDPALRDLSEDDLAGMVDAAALSEFGGAIVDAMKDERETGPPAERAPEATAPAEQ